MLKCLGVQVLSKRHFPSGAEHNCSDGVLASGQLSCVTRVFFLGTNLISSRRKREVLTFFFFSLLLSHVRTSLWTSQERFQFPVCKQQLVRTCKSRWVLSFQKMKAREKLFAMVNDYSTGEKKSKGNQGKQREFRKHGRLWRTFLRSKGLSKAIPQGKGTCSYYQLFLSAWMWNGRM